MRKSTTNATHDIQYHFVWIPKYRKRVLSDNIKFRLEQLIQECSEVNSFEILELNIQMDHVHLFLSAKPRFSPSEIMRLIKGGSLRKLRE